MKLRLAGEFREFELEEQEGRVSRATGSKLRSISIDFFTPLALQEAVENDLNARSIKADDGSTWNVGNWSSTHNGNSDRKRYEVDLHESDDITVEQISFQDLELTVSHYAHDDGGGTGPAVIRAVVEVTEEHAKHIRSLHEVSSYFDLTRSGVTRDPIRVRLGRPTWQWIESRDPDQDPTGFTTDTHSTPPRNASGGQNTRRFELVFVTEDGDSEDVQTPSDWQDVWVARWARENRAQMSALLSELVQTGCLDTEAAERVVQAGKNSDPLDLRRIPSSAPIWQD
ncbi:hypothetical protein [Nocardioides sp. 1609]|uniref:hypothetical protein n=1 Tax=Nocardioides sp. 1609 TaxID=2508327 RepID=UPI00106F79AE|nr:hypothetical protein [Nocardioides sp. 1609]